MLVKQVDRTGRTSGVVNLVTADAGCCAVFQYGADCQGRAVSRQSYPAELVPSPGIGGLDVCLLTPRHAATREHVDRTGLTGGVVGWVAADASRRTSLAG